MPPLPPNMARQTIIRTTPSWSQRHFARKDNHIRFLTRRFPNKPRDDPGLPNPPLPPGASRLAFHTGSTGLKQHNPISHQWVAVAELPVNLTGQVRKVGLAISDNSETLVIGYPLDNQGGDAIVKAFTYSEDGGLIQKGDNIVFGTPPYTDQYAGGQAVAISNTGDFMLVGNPSVGSDPWTDLGNVFPLTYDTNSNSWTQGAYTSYAPFVNGINYGWSASLSDFDSTNMQWYSTAGAPGVEAFWIVTFDQNGAFKANIGTDAPDPALSPFSNVGGTELLGYTSSISNIQGGTTIYAAAGAPNLQSTGTAFVRVVKGVLSGGLWTWSKQQDITKTPDSQFGRSLSMTLDGSIIIAGDPVKHKVYVYASTDGWSSYSLLGQEIQGASGTGTGFSVAIDRYASATNPEGTTIVIGQPGYNHPLRPSAGRVLVFEYINGGWKQVLNAVTGKSENEFLGQAVAMRSSEAFLAAGSQQTSGRAALFSVRQV